MFVFTVAHFAHSKDVIIETVRKQHATLGEIKADGPVLLKLQFDPISTATVKSLCSLFAFSRVYISVVLGKLSLNE